MTNWTAAAKLFDTETETLEGDGIILRPNGTIETAEAHFGEMQGDLYVEDDVWYYDGHPLHEGTFEAHGGFEYTPMHESENITPEFLKYHAHNALDEGKAVFLGATSYSITDEDSDYYDTAAWFFIRKILD